MHNDNAYASIARNLWNRSHLGQETVPTDGDGTKPRPQSKRLQQTQAQVDEVVGIMRTNVEKVLERDQKLSQMDERADALQEGASQFEQSAKTLQSKYWWKNLKMMIIIGAIVLVIIIIIIANVVNKRRDKILRLEIDGVLLARERARQRAGQ